MAKTIPQLTDATTINAADELIVQQGGITKRATGAELAKGLNAINGTVNVKDFGAVGDGVSDDTAAIQTAIQNVSTKTIRVLFFPAGTYLVSEPLTISGSNWTIYGEGASVSVIKTTANDNIITLDRTAGTMVKGEIANLGFDRAFTLPYSNSCGIRVASSASTGGIYAWKFTNLQFQHLYRCIRFNPTEKELWQGVPSIEKHSFCQFSNIKVLASSAFQPFECITFDQGCGPHHTIIGGNLFASGNGSSCIKIGDGGGNNGFGDLLIVAVHMTDSEHGVRLVGPTNSGIYNQNVTVTGCQFDGASMQYTIAASNMQNCRFFPNNSTSSGNIVLTDCSNITYQTSTNQYLFPQTIAGSIARLSNGVTFGASSQEHSASGYVKDSVQWSNNTTGAIKMIAKSRGSGIGSHSPIQSGDRISEDRYLGSNGSTFVPAAQVVVDATETATGASTNVASKIEIRTSPNGTTSPVARIIADEAGNVALAGNGQSTPTDGVNGFVYMQKMLGNPTGTPAKTYSGKIPVVVDETNLRMYAYCAGQWRYAQLT
jgi:hypothetical protein